MKKHLISLFYLSAFLLIVLLSGCKKEDEPIPVPSVQITEVVASKNSISFQLILKDATKYAYSLALATEVNPEKKFVSDITKSQINATNLLPDTEYAIRVIAYNGDIASKEVEQKVVTNKDASLSLSDFVTTYYDAKVTVTLINSNEFYYTTYRRDARPETPEFIKVEGKSTADIVVENLIGQANYTFEAYAVNAEGQGATILKNFRTQTTPDPVVFEVKSASPRKVVISLTKTDRLCKEFYYNYFSNSDEMTEEDFKNDVNSEYPMAKMSSSSIAEYIPDFVQPNTGYVLYILPVDANGVKMDKVYKYEFSTPGFEIGKSAAKATVKLNGEPKSVSIPITITPSADCKEYYLGHVDKSTLPDGNIINYLNGGTFFDDNYPKSIDRIDRDKFIGGLKSEKTYIVFTIGVDKDGFLGAVTSFEATTPKLDFSSKATVAITNVVSDLTSLSYTFNFENTCTKARYYFCPSGTKSREEVLEDLLSAYPFGVVTENKQTVLQEYLDMGTEYDLWVLPEDANMDFGKLVTYTHKTKQPVYHEQPTVALSVVNNGFYSDGVWKGKAKMAPDAACSKYIFNTIPDESVVALGLNTPEKLANFIIKNGYNDSSYEYGNDGYVKTDDQGNNITGNPKRIMEYQFNMWEITWIVAIPVNANGDYGKPVSQKFGIGVDFNSNPGGGSGDPDPKKHNIKRATVRR